MARKLAWRSGWLLACPHEADLGHREGSLVKFAAAQELLGCSGPKMLLPSRQSTGAGPVRRGAQRSAGRAAVSAARAARRAALTPTAMSGPTAMSRPAPPSMLSSLPGRNSGGTAMSQTGNGAGH